MKYFVFALAVAAGLLYIFPDFLVKIPFPLSETHRHQETQRAATECVENQLAFLKKNWERPKEVTRSQWNQLIGRPTFQKYYCLCEAEILSFVGLIPSNFLPSIYRKRAMRSVASELSTHIKTPQGQEQMTYCFFHAWNRDAYSLDPTQ